MESIIGIIICIAIVSFTIAISIWLSIKPFLLIVKKVLSKLDKIDWVNFGLKTKTLLKKDSYSVSNEWFAKMGKEIEEKEKEINKSAEELKEFKEKEGSNEKTRSFSWKIIDDYKKLVESQQNLLLKEREAKARLEEELKGWQQIYSWVEESRDDYHQESKEFENKFWQLRIILSWYGFEQKDIDKIVDGNTWPLEWGKKPEIQKKEQEITQKRFKCSRCDKCNNNS